MKFSVVVALSLLTLVQGGSLRSRIVNGEEAKLSERPFQVSLQKSQHFCGGSIISEYYVVTAAHCLEGQSPEALNVIVGTVSLEKATLKHKVERIIMNEHYNPYEVSNDIGLIKVAKPFNFTEFVQPIPLPEAHFEVKTNTTAVVSGWGGLLASNGPFPDKLQKVNIFIADQIYCKNVMEEKGLKIFPTNICANDLTVRRGQRNGDSGGPLTAKEVLIGIVSWSVKDPTCASSKYPGVYTRVSEFTDWIKKHVE